MPIFAFMTSEQIAHRRAANKAGDARRRLAAGLPPPKSAKPRSRTTPFRPPPKAKPLAKRTPAPSLGPIPPGLNDPQRRIALAARGLGRGQHRHGLTPHGPRPANWNHDRAAEHESASFGQRAAALAAHDLPLEDR